MFQINGVFVVPGIPWLLAYFLTEQKFIYKWLKYDSLIQWQYYITIKNETKWTKSGKNAQRIKWGEKNTKAANHLYVHICLKPVYKMTVFAYKLSWWYPRNS